MYIFCVGFTVGEMSIWKGYQSECICDWISLVFVYMGCLKHRKAPLKFYMVV